MTKVRTTRWYLEPRDAETNETAMMDMVRECGATDDRIHRGKKDYKGRGHNVVEVNHVFIARMEANAEKFKLLFRVFTQAEGDSRMKPWPFGDKKKLHRIKKVAQVRKALARQTERCTAGA